MEPAEKICKDTRFPERYYALVDRFPTGGPSASSLLEFVEYFEGAGFSVSKDTVEKFIRLREAEAPDYGLNVCPGKEKLELIFVSPKFGFTFHRLAYDGVRKNHPELVRNPRYPRVNLPSEDDLHDLATEVHAIYRDLRSSVG